ncbi:MAG TPA: hypothetical protein DEV93_14790 [Chloroflexi bacterium]|nr:hypothetical protein [Chloroflexota bacterium]
MKYPDGSGRSGRVDRNFERTFPVAVVGLGRAGAFSVEALRDLRWARVVGGVDLLGDEAPAAITMSCPIFRSVSELRGSVPVDVAIVATPTASHPGIVAELLGAGPNRPRRVLVEKPLAASRPGLARCAMLAKRTRTDLRTLLHATFTPEVLWASRHRSSLERRHGAIRSVRSEFSDPYRDDITIYTAKLGSAWIDSGINALSVAARFVDLGSVMQVHGQSPLQCDAVVAIAGSPSSGSVSIRAQWSSRSREKSTTLTFEDGSRAILSHSKGELYVLTPAGAHERKLVFGRSTGARRYRPMLHTYINDGPDLLSRDLEATIHDIAASVAAMNWPIDAIRLPYHNEAFN